MAEWLKALVCKSKIWTGYPGFYLSPRCAEASEVHGVQTVCWSALGVSGAQQAQLFDKMLSSDPMPSLLLAWFLRTDQCLMYALVSYVPRSSSVLFTFKEYPNIGFYIVFNTSLIQFLYYVTFTINRLVNL